MMLLDHRDLPGRAAYDDFLREVVMPRNRRNTGAFRLQRQERMLCRRGPLRTAHSPNRLLATEVQTRATNSNFIDLPIPHFEGKTQNELESDYGCLARDP
jgi:hypothetical protein